MSARSRFSLCNRLIDRSLHRTYWLASSCSLQTSLSRPLHHASGGAYLPAQPQMNYRLLSGMAASKLVASATNRPFSTTCVTSGKHIKRSRNKMPNNASMSPLFEFQPETKLSPLELTESEQMNLCSVQPNQINPVIYKMFPKYFVKVASAIDDHTYFIRNAMRTIGTQLIKQNESTDLMLTKFFLYGPPGCGRSLTISHFMHSCNRNGWVVLHHANDSRFHYGRFKEKVDVQPSTWNVKRFDQPAEAMEWLKEFEQINSSFLQKITTTGEYVFSSKEKVEKGEPLSNIIKLGLYRGSYASDAVGILLKEVAMQDQYKVLFACDSVNALYGKSFLKYKGEIVPIEKLSLIRHFSKLLKPESQIMNGCSLVAMSDKVFGSMPSDFKNDFHPKAILPKEVHQQFSSFTHLTVSEYTEAEYNIVMKYYKQKEWLQRNLTPALLEEISFYTYRNPNKVLQYIRAL